MITDTGTDTAAAAATATMLLTAYFFVSVLAYVFVSFVMGKIFTKAGVEPWKAWVPVYNTWVFLELGGQKGWLILLAFLPGVNIIAGIFMIIAAYNIGLAFNKNGAWVLLYIFLSPVWFLLLAFDSSTYNSGMTGGNLPYSPAPSYGVSTQQYGGHANAQPTQQYGGLAKSPVTPYAEQQPKEPKPPQFSSYYVADEPEEEEDDPFGIIPPKPRKPKPEVVAPEDLANPYINPTALPIPEPIVEPEPKKTGGYKRPDLSKINPPQV